MNDVRRPRSYKINDSVYKKAMRKAAKNKKKLATMIEEAVYEYQIAGNKDAKLYIEGSK
jgi:hypothetical protein